MASGASAGYLSIALVSFFSFIAHVSAITLAGALVINLDDDRARWNATLSQLASSVLVSSTPPGIVRIQGVAAESLDLHHLIVDGKLTRAAYNDIIAQDRIVTGDSLTLGALGCLQSHVLAWERIVELNQPALIFEDDVTISPDFDAGITLALHHLPDDFGLLYLANVIGDSVQKHLTPYDDEGTLWRMDGGHYGTYAYVVSPFAAAVLLDAIYPAYAQVDSIIIDVARKAAFPVFMSRVSLVSVDNSAGRNSRTQRWDLSPLRIPSIIHVVAMNSTASESVKTNEALKTWTKLHPDWRIKLWKNVLDPDSELFTLYNSDNRVQNARALRFELVWRFGGVAVDIDALKPLRSIEPLIRGVDAFFAYDVEDGSSVSDSIFGAIPHHPLIGHLAIEAANVGFDKERLGLTVRLQVRDFNFPIRMFESHLFYPFAISCFAGVEPDASALAYAVPNDDSWTGWLLHWVATVFSSQARLNGPSYVRRALAGSGSVSVSPSISLTQSQTPTHTRTRTQSGTRTGTRTGTQTPSPSESISVTLTPSQTFTPSSSSTASRTQSPSMTPSQLETVTTTPSNSQIRSAIASSSPSASATQSQSSEMPYTLLMSSSANAVTLRSLTISDSLPVSKLRLWLNRCPASNEADVLSTASISCVVTNSASPPSVFVALGPIGTDALSATVTSTALFAVAAPCVVGSDQLVQIATAVFVGANFRPLQKSAVLECSIWAAGVLPGVPNASSGLLALASIRLVVLPSQWPLWDDAIVISASGAMRSARLGVVINATMALYSAADRASNRTDVMRAADVSPTLVAAQASPTIILAAARDVWTGNEASFNYSRLLDEAALASGRDAFSLVLSGVSRVVLFAGLTGQNIPFTFNATIGGVICNVSAISEDGVWALLDTPSAAALCGASGVVGDCGYAALTLTSTPSLSVDALGVSLTCPTFCPGTVYGNAFPIAVTVPSEGFSLGTAPQSLLGALPTLLPDIESDVSSEGIYYAAACSETGLWTDPASGACTNATDPASRNCALGSGAGCSACPSGALCPGGSRLWPRIGFWAPNEVSDAVSACGPPDPDIKCGGWNISRATVQCGLAYRFGSPLCGACAPGFYLPGDGSCIACPVVAGVWNRYQGIVKLLGGVLVSALCVGLVLVALVRLFGGTLNGSAVLLAGLVQWSVAALQTVAQAAPASAAALPPFLATVFRGLAVLQLDGVLLPPACTGAYAFESQAAIMGAALLLSLIFLGALQRPLPLSKRVHGLLQTTGGAAARAVLLLYPPAARDALALLNCSPVAVSPSGCISLNGCSGSSSVGSSNDRSRTVTVRVLASNPFYVCWAPGASHVTAGGLAVAVLIVVVLAFPLFSYVVLWRSAGRETSLQQRMITRGGRGGLETAGSAMVDNPLLLLSLGPSASMRSKQNSSHRHSAPIKSPVAPFLSDYRPDAWYMRHADLALTLLLACLQAFIPTPTSNVVLVGKAVTIVLATLVLALHILWSRPFAQEHAWKGPVRAALLVLAAASAAVVAWAGALDLRIIGGARAVAALTAGAYFLVVLFSITIVTLVVGVATAMMKGARDESVRIHDAEAARALAEMHSECPSISEPASPSNDQVMCSIAVEATNLGSTHDASVVKVASAAAAATASAADDQVSFTTQSARRLGRRGGHGSSRRRQRPALFSGNPGLTAAAASLRAGATASDTDVRDACESILSSLASLSADEASRASSALLPGLSGWLKTIVSYDSVGEGTGVALVAVCRAMAALSDHADADTMAQLRKSELPRQLVALLQRGGRSSAQRDGTESFLSQALWVLGNATADKGLAAEFISAGGAGVLVALIDISDSSSAISDASFQVCVSIASISMHAAAAIALLDAGVLGPLARCFLRGIGGSNVARAETSPQSQPCLRNLRGESVVDAEAASRALANVLRWWGGGWRRARPPFSICVACLQ